MQTEPEPLKLGVVQTGFSSCPLFSLIINLAECLWQALGLGHVPQQAHVEVSIGNIPPRRWGGLWGGHHYHFAKAKDGDGPWLLSIALHLQCVSDSGLLGPLVHHAWCVGEEEESRVLLVEVETLTDTKQAAGLYINAEMF